MCIQEWKKYFKIPWSTIQVNDFDIVHSFWFWWYFCIYVNVIYAMLVLMGNFLQLWEKNEIYDQMVNYTECSLGLSTIYLAVHQTVSIFYNLYIITLGDFSLQSSLHSVTGSTYAQLLFLNLFLSISTLRLPFLSYDKTYFFDDFSYYFCHCLVFHLYYYIISVV